MHIEETINNTMMEQPINPNFSSIAAAYFKQAEDSLRLQAERFKELTSPNLSSIAAEYSKQFEDSRRLQMERLKELTSPNLSSIATAYFKQAEDSLRLQVLDILKKWKGECGEVPKWLRKRRNIIPSVLISKTADSPNIPQEPPKPNIPLIRSDDVIAIKSARAKINSDKAKEKADSKRLKLKNDFLASGLSKNEFAAKHHHKYHITKESCRKKLQGIENK